MHDSPRWALRAAAALIGLGTLLMPFLAYGQGSTVYQQGTVVPNHLAKWFTNGRVGDVGGILGDSNGLGVSPFAITDNNGLGLCSYTGPTTGAPNSYKALCLGHQTNGDALLSVTGGGSLDIQINGVLLPVPGAVSGVPVVADNTALQAQPSSFAALVIRQDHTIGLGAPPTFYQPSASPCTLGTAGSGDGGSQVKTSNGGCWLIAKNQRLTPEIWGAKGTGTDDDTGHLNDALAYVGTIGSGVLSGKGKYGISGTITVKQNTTFEGGGWDNGKIVLLNGSFTPAIKMESRTQFNNWFVDATPQNAGVVIKMGSPGDYRSSISRVLTSKGCVALDVDGIGHTVRDADFELMSATAGCGGVRVGHSSTKSTPTVEFRIVDSIMKCDFTLPTRADFGLLLEESEGGYYGPGNDIIGCINGTVIKPGAAQQVALSYFNDSVQGDTSQQIGLLIDTGDTSANVQDNTFVQGWTSASTAPGGQGIVIQNTGGGKIAGTKFIGHRAYINYNNAIELKTPTAGTIIDTVFDMATVCGTQIGANFVLGDNSNVTIRNSRIGKNCENFVGGSTTGLLYGIGIGNNVQLFATGNDLSYGGAETWSPTSGLPARNSVIGSNTVDATAGPSYVAASTVTLNIMSKRYHLTAAGAATVNTITPAWNGQELCIVGENLAGAITFGTSGNIRYAATIPSGGGMVCGYYDSTFSKWILH